VRFPTSEIFKRLSLSYKEAANISKEVKAKFKVKSIDTLAEVAIKYNSLFDR